MKTESKHTPESWSDLLEALSQLHIAVTMRPMGQGGLSSAERVALDKARAAITKAKEEA